tara:strand:- start:536 stop:2242 length:1707 start_codon:yes stop_codon:yes gene_type:complete
MQNLSILFSYYLLIIISILGYGFFFLKIFDKKLDNNNFGYVGLFGLYVLLIYSYLSNFIIAHSEAHNFLIIIIGFFLFILKIQKNYSKFKKQIFFTFIVFLFLSSSLILFKNHDDFPYYHFPYTYYLTQQSFYFGVGQFNHGFRTPSSIFYLNSLFYLPSAKHFLFNFTSVYILGFVNIILLKKIHNFFDYFKIKKQDINLTNYLSLFSLIFINIFFYRISEHGTDRSAQILIFLLVIELLVLVKLKRIKSLDLFNIYLLGSLIISLKAFYILYVILIIPLFLLIKSRKQENIKVINFLILNKFFVLFLLLLFFVLFSYFVNTGCIIYPLSMTCFDSLNWSIPSEQVQAMNNWYELWAKGGAAPNFRVSNPDHYILGFNWLNNWIDIYFFNKVSDFILGLLLLIIIVVIFFRREFFKEKSKKVNNHIYITYFIILILGFEWFYNHPSLRYGGYCIVALLCFIPVCLKLDVKNFDFKKYTRSIFILIFIAMLVFNVRNIMRIGKEISFYSYKPSENVFYFVSDDHFRIQKQMNNFIVKYNECINLKKACDLAKQKIYQNYGKMIFKKND